MSRPIKFRAWDKDKKEIREVTGINWYDEYMWVDETPMSGDRLSIEGTPLMQYTGLVDKNGTEIYEGDIVRIGYEEKEEYEVKWRVQGFWPALTSGSIEVIGNIWEHKHLIESHDSK